MILINLNEPEILTHSCELRSTDCEISIDTGT